jgi:hypothetical protein
VPISDEEAATRDEWFQLGFCLGRSSRDDEVSRLEYTADRLYVEMCRRTPPKPVDRPSFAQLERIRDDMYAGR